MQSIQIAIGMTLAPGDEMLVPTPTWPNAASAANLRGARAVPVPMSYTQAGFALDFERLAAAVTPRTRAMFINSPANPTGWVASHDDLRALLDLSRRHGLWIIADEIYARFWYGEGVRAPSFHDVMEEDDRVIFVQTFSKNWSMTGWRIGWIEAPPALGQVIENMIQYSTSGVAGFMQRAGIVALEQGEELIRAQIARARTGRDIVCKALGQVDRVRFVWPQGAFYLFFTVEGADDTRKLALDLVDTANVGLAPGTAFGPGGEGFLRLCYLRSAGQLEEATRRLAAALA
jgi:aspartate/methionine/tyrosine aminotransferase